ncbi:hypothetical protein LOK49_LG12G02923 [Camellia lanceoleosa]|uniref:Uncharacterized protein n=1 Tax=Camellia lanceoleosa TaxID=1840588 RepID=A0ACC0FQY6_9ERIC|nr:hypothetical protein LOK49_LG12G02923 [Camellia lanceoleosa]
MASSSSSSRRSIDMGRRNRGGPVIVRCTENPQPPIYDKYFCLSAAEFDDSYNIKEWYMLNLSSNNNNEKERKEMSGKRFVQNFPTPELRAVRLAVNHDERHRGENPATLPLIAQLENGKADREYGTCSAMVGSRIYRFGGSYSDEDGRGYHNSRLVIYFDVNHPEKGWKKGPRTICGREDAAVVVVDGKIFVFGGNERNIPGLCCEFLNTNLEEEEEEGGGGGNRKRKGKGKWSPLKHDAPSSLGYDNLFATAAPDGKILVGARASSVLFMFDVANQYWEKIALHVHFMNSISKPIVVGTQIYWIEYDFPQLHICDFVHGNKLSVPIADFKICQYLSETSDDTYAMNMTLTHLADDVFCIVWLDNESLLLHCTVVRISTTIGVSVLCCHSYGFHQPTSFLDCLPMDLPLLG